ncbi:MAG: phosphatidate cytidylyltransferase, partial [Candidatus Binatia bacterium]
VVTIGLIGSLLNPNDPAQAIGHVAHTVLGVLYAGAFLPHFIWLRAGTGEDGAAWVLYVLAVAMAGDTAAYFAGRSFGRHRLMPSVSPKKTVEGAIGAFGGNLLAAAAVKALLMPSATWTEVLVLALVAGVLAQVGDLCESLLKRAFGAKDSGWLLPGHGGVLDRADSLVFPVVFVYYYVALTR